MIFRGALGRRPAMLSVKDTSISLAFEAAWVAAWDFGGRLYSLWKGGETYRRGLSGRLLHKPARSADVRRRVPLDGAAADKVLEETAGQAALLARSLKRDAAGAWAASDGRHPSAEVGGNLSTVARKFDAAAARADAARFAEIHFPHRDPAAGPIPVHGAAGLRRVFVRHLHVLRPLPRRLPREGGRRVPAPRGSRARLPFHLLFQTVEDQIPPLLR